MHIVLLRIDGIVVAVITETAVLGRGALCQITADGFRIFTCMKMV